MTAEVAILNREAVALAADSAVTLMGLEDLKIYNANKLFALSSIEPVAVMIYGSGYFGPVPWETIVKEYRRKFASSSHSTVDDYASEFIEYLGSFVKYISDKDQISQVRVTAMSELQGVQWIVQNRIRMAESMGDPFQEDELQPLVLECIEERIKDIKRNDPDAEISASLAGKQINTAIDDWTDFANELLGHLPINKKIIQRARVMVRAAIMFVPLHSRNPRRSGVVVTGFGTDQLFPALSHYLVDGVIAGKVRVCYLDSERISEQQSASIRAFAQGDMVTTFMEGVDPNYTYLLKTYRAAREHFYDEMIVSLVQYYDSYMGSPLPNTKRSDLLGKMKKMRVDGFKKLDSQINAYRDDHPEQILAIVKWLPKEDLSEMAEALVNLTSFKRRVTPEAETVGGPIDVAVISKGDGLIWIKRNLYFEPELNRRFFDLDRSLHTS